MEELKNVEKKVEKVRKKLNEEISKSKDLTSKHILEISRELDKLLLEYQKKLNKNWNLFSFFVFP